MKKIAFLTGTRADFGKIKSLLLALDKHQHYEVYVFVTGMHLLETYGLTIIEVKRTGITNIHAFLNHTDEASMDLTLAKTIEGFSDYVKNIQPDMIVIHGDRVEALAGAIVGSLNNTLVAHIEGGEVSGTIDELLRHATSKMSHLHYVSNAQAKTRLIQMGELPESVYEIGSPDVDIMFSNTLPALDEVKRYYEIPFKEYSVVMFHPVTTEAQHMSVYAQQFVNALLESTQNFVVIYPNNDLGSSHILEAYKKLKNDDRFKLFPSIRFEYFLTLLKNSELIIGNSSAGIREAPYYGIPTINVGTRQKNRALHSHIIHTSYDKETILTKLNSKLEHIDVETVSFGKGDSAERFIKTLDNPLVWTRNHQKQFRDI